MTDVLTADTIGGLPVQDTGGDEEEFLNILIYGDSGIGKTVLSGSASVVPEMEPVVVLDIEGGARSLSQRYPGAKKIRITSFNDLERVYADLKTKDHGFKTVVIDSLTEARAFGMYEIMKRAVQKAAEDGETRDPDLPGIGEWGKSSEQTKRLIRAFRDLPMHTIFVCLASTDKDKKGRSLTKPMLPGKMGTEVAAFLDIVLYMYRKEDPDTEQVGRYLLAQYTDEYVAKDRTDLLPPVIEEPTMQKLFDFILNSDEPTTESED